MDTQLKRYARKLVEEQLGQSRLQLAQIADDISWVKTQQDKKFSEPEPYAAKPFLTRFKILICGVHPADANPVSLPWAYPPFSTSGLRGESLGLPILPRGTFVYVSRDTQTGEYFIERIAPNVSPDLPLISGSPYGAVSGADPRSAGTDGSPLSDTQVGNSRVLGNEIFGFNGPSLADMLQNSPRDEAKWQFPTLDGAQNTVGGMSAAIENSIKDVERIKKGLIGDNSALRQSLEALDKAEKSVEAISAALKKQVKLISGYINTIMKKAQKKVLRMINQMMNKITAAGPLSGKFANNQLINKAIKVSSCAFNLAISEMPNMVGQGLMGIVNKAVNTSNCLIENFVSNFVGQITGQLSALIEGAMGSISNVLGGGTDVLGSIGDVLGSIMNLLKCEVTPQAGDPVVKEWNLLDGGAPVKISLNTDNIFNKAKEVGKIFKETTKVPPNINKYKFKFDPSQIAEQTMSECGDMGPDQCGPPSVTFWGGEGKGAKGNPVISTAEENFGQLMGVDVVQSGNYTEPPFVHVADECGGGRGAVLEAILGPVVVDPPVEDFTGNVGSGGNTVDNFNFAPLADGLEPSDLIGMEVTAETDILPEGTVITAIEGDTLVLSNEFTEDGNDVQFRIVGNTPPGVVGVTTFNVSVKNTPLGEEAMESKFVVDNRVQRQLCSDGYSLERGKTYHFDQSSPSNGLVLKVGTDEFALVEGERIYDIDTKWYDEVRIHPLRFSEKSDGIHNCDRDDVIDDPEEWVSPIPEPGDSSPNPSKLALTDWVLTDSQGWSSFLKNYGIYPAVDDPQYKVIGTSSATWRVATFTPGQYTVEMQADNVGTIYWDGVKLGSTQPYAGHNRNLKFQFYAGEIEPAIHEIKVEIENKIHRDGRTAVDYASIEQNPAAVAWVLKDPGGTIIKTSLDEFGVPGFADILYGYNSYFSIKAYNVSTKLDTPEDDEWFDCETDYKSARLLGFTDCDIRHFLENNPDIALDACMLAKLNDKNWGKCDGDLMVSLTAPGCPPPPCLPNNTYPVIVCLDEIFVENTGFGFDPCKDTVKIEPANGAKAEIDVSVNGQINSIKVTDCGSGFTELPEISINTKTGYNAILKPIMKFHRPGEIDVPKGTSVIQVVDCVGKVV